MRRFLSWVAVIAVGTSLPAEEFQPAANTPQISLEVRFASVPSSSWQKLGLKPTAIVPPQAEEAPVTLDRAEIEPGKQAIQLVSAIAVTESRPPVSYQIMPPEQTTQLMKVAQGDRRSNILQSPKVTVFSGQTAQVHSTTKRPFVVENNHVSDEGVFGIDINTVEIEDGAILIARADICEDGSIDLALMFDAIQISGVSTSQVGQSTVQVPENQSCKIQLASHLQNGETLAIWCDKLNTTKERKRTVRKWYGTSWTAVARESTPLLLMVTPRVIEAEDVVEPESK